MAIKDSEHLAVGYLADQAAEAVRLLNHRQPPGDPAQVMAALALMTHRPPQLLGQLAGWFENQHSASRLRVDAFASVPEPSQTVHAVVDSLRRASRCMQRATVDLDTAHDHTTHLATTETRDRG